MPKQQDDREARDLAQMQNPDEWPLWPLLPIKRSVKGGSWPETALLFANGEPVVIKGDLYQLDKRPGTTYAEKFAGLEKQAYLSFEAMVADGWRVD